MGQIWSVQICTDQDDGQVLGICAAPMSCTCFQHRDLCSAIDLYVFLVRDMCSAIDLYVFPTIDVCKWCCTGTSFVETRAARNRGELKLDRDITQNK